MRTHVFGSVRVGSVSSQQADRKEQFFELGVFLLLILPSMALSFFAIQQNNVGFSLSAVATILRDLSLVSLILFFLRRNHESIHSIGWTSTTFWKELAWGVILFVPLFYASEFLENALRAAGLSGPRKPMPAFLFPRGPVEILLAIIMVAVVAIAEETIFRGYLLLRFKGLMNIAAAVLLSAAVFSFGHSYEGMSGLVTIGFMGIMFAQVYTWRRSLVAPMVMHFLQDFTVIVLFPLLSLIH